MKSAAYSTFGSYGGVGALNSSLVVDVIHLALVAFFPQADLGDGHQNDDLVESLRFTKPLSLYIDLPLIL